MTRVESHHTRQALLVVGNALQVSPLPEKLELFTEDGQPVDVGKDRTRARWRGTWDITPDAPYEQNDFVMDDDKLWILSDILLIEEAVRPSESTSGAWVLMTVSGGMKWGGGWVDDLDYQDATIVRHTTGLWIADGDISAGLEPEVAGGLATRTAYIRVGGSNYDKTDVPIIEVNVPFTDFASAPTGNIWATGTKVLSFDAPPDVEITVTTDDAIDPKGVVAYRDTGASGAGNTEIDNHSFANPRVFTMPAEGRVSLEVYEGSTTLLVEAVGVEGAPKWELLVSGEIPAGGADGYILAKASAADGDVEWVVAPETADELPAGGADTYILAKASAADGDVEWVPAPEGGVRRIEEKTTASLTAAADTGDIDTRLSGEGESGVWDLGAGTLLTNISVDRLSRIRFYTTAAKRTADVGRDRFTDPQDFGGVGAVQDHGCLAEFLLLSTLTLDNIPADYLVSGAGDADIYYRIDNYSLTAGAVTVTVTIKDVEI